MTKNIDKNEIPSLDTDVLYIIMLMAMFDQEYINDNVVIAATEYASRQIALNKEVPVWVGALRGVTRDCDREEAARYAAREFCEAYLAK